MFLYRYIVIYYYYISIHTHSYINKIILYPILQPLPTISILILKQASSSSITTTWFAIWLVITCCCIGGTNHFVMIPNLSTCPCILYRFNTIWAIGGQTFYCFAHLVIFCILATIFMVSPYFHIDGCFWYMWFECYIICCTARSYFNRISKMPLLFCLNQ